MSSEMPENEPAAVRHHGHTVCARCGAPLRDGRPCGLHLAKRDPVVPDEPNPDAKPVGQQVGEYLLRLAGVTDAEGNLIDREGAE